jgi:hypothetical protein
MVPEQGHWLEQGQLGAGQLYESIRSPCSKGLQVSLSVSLPFQVSPASPSSQHAVGLPCLYSLLQSPCEQWSLFPQRSALPALWNAVAAVCPTLGAEYFIPLPLPSCGKGLASQARAAEGTWRSLSFSAEL